MIGFQSPGMLYGDFTGASSYLASLRLDRLQAAGQRVPDWRAVEHRPTLPVAGIRLQPAARSQRTAEITGLRGLLQYGEDFPAAVAPMLAHPGPAALAYAAAYDAGLADQVRGLLFHAYWVDGKDIGDAEVLLRLLPPSVAQRTRTATTAAERRRLEWQREWLDLGTGVDLVLVDRLHMAVGTAALERLAPCPTCAPRPATPPRPRSAGPVSAGLG